MPLHFSAPDWCFFREGMDPAWYYARLRDCGIDGVEMAPPGHFAAARAVGLRLLNVSGPGMAEGLNRRAHHAALLPQLRRAIDDAAAAGIPHVIVFSGNAADGLPEAEGIAACAEGLAAVAPHAHATGVTLIFEMLNTFDHPGYEAASTAYGVAVARAVGHPAVKVLFDLYHLARMGEDPQASLLAHLDLAAHIHVAAVPDRSAPRPGSEIPYPAIVRAATAAGYTGAWGLEYLPSADIFTELANGAAWMRGEME